VTSRPDAAAAARAERRGALLVACAAVCWSSGGLIVRLVGTGPWTTSFWRSAFAALFLSAVLWLVRGQSIVGQWRAGGWPVLAVAACMALASTCFIFSLARTSVANTLILMATGPYVAGLLGWLVLGERVAPRTWLAMGVALVGAVVMVSGSYGHGALAGDLLAVAMAASFAVATVLIRRHPEIPMAPAAALATALTALVALPHADPLGTAPRDLALLAFFGVGQFGAGFLLFTTGARAIPVARSALLGLLETVLGPLWVWLLLREQPGAASLAGGVLILAALLANTLVDAVAPARASAIVRGEKAPGPGASKVTGGNR
jgi:drug/metabolite transporter (DMT)-like permease